MPQVKTRNQQEWENKVGKSLDRYMLAWWRERAASGQEPTLVALAEHLGISEAALRTWLNDYGLELRATLVRKG